MEKYVYNVCLCNMYKGTHADTPKNYSLGNNYLIYSKTQPCILTICLLVQICRKYRSMAATPFSLGALSEFKGERLQFPDPVYCILNFCFLKPILRTDKLQLSKCQQEEPQAGVFVAPCRGRGWSTTRRMGQNRESPCGMDTTCNGDYDRNLELTLVWWKILHPLGLLLFTTWK